MRTTFKCIGFLIGLGCLSSCNKPDISQASAASAQVVKDTIEFRGETVAVSRVFPKKYFNQSTEDFVEYYNQQNQQANLRTNTGEDFITGDEMLAILQPLAKKYPDLSWEKEISEPDLRRIYADFKTITTPEEVREKSDALYGAGTGNFQHLMYYIN
ncbi:hypothetical protein [Dyadobacter sp. CY323]|uniref:hypothetical protein n=1 Tax=Dyadobacter sp. CY323 TaxID=2907302 RepID=UPI001F20056B|nr:hypothetical protein [Dyadobacter sp. CY323]MCE6991951.1 hypothetical protein [Dyadobacter sp. CY323]